MERTPANRLPAITSGDRKAMPDGLWNKCPECKEITYVRELQRNSKVCPRCDYHYAMNGEERAEWFIEEDSFVAIGRGTTAFMGRGQVGEREIAFGVLDAENAGSCFPTHVFGEFATLIAEATERALPVVLFCASSASVGLSDPTSSGAIRLFKALDDFDALGLPLLLVVTDATAVEQPPLSPFADVVLVETAQPFADRADLQAPRTDMRTHLERLIAFAAPKDDHGKRPSR